MSRVTRMALGLIVLFFVLGATGSVATALGADGETAGWIALFVGLVGILTAIWWALRAPPARTDDASARYWVALRHARRPDEQAPPPASADGDAP